MTAARNESGFEPSPTGLTDLVPVRPRFVIPERERDMQRRAIDPKASAWVSANAGSGKTTILTKRVIRLLLSGVAPEKILCLTYTKTAAAEMQNRVFEELGRWVTLHENELSRAIEELEGRRPDRQRMARARRLFAGAVETPGGLKIQTIHAFCERLLHLFPFEANVPARFRLMDEAEQSVILDGCIAAAQAGSGLEGDEAFAQALKRMAEETEPESFATIIRSALAHENALADHAAMAEDGPQAGLHRLQESLGLLKGEDEARIDEEMLSGGINPSGWKAIAAVFAAGSTNDKKVGAAIEAAISLTEPAAKAAAWVQVFTKSDGARKEKIGTKAIPPAIEEKMLVEGERLHALLDRRRAASVAARTAALFVVADRVAKLYFEQKRRRSVLDFDDVIRRTANLLERTDSRWVLYKLDAGLEHLLVDEAQDTSPEQWRILGALTEEFFSERMPDSRQRSIFAVGDEKQSIYSFQGAAPQEFDQKRAIFRKRVEDAGGVFHSVDLQLSFRTTADILSMVDEVFQGERYVGLGSIADQRTVHQTARVGMPGLVEIWPPEEPEEQEEIDPDDEVDILPVTSTEVRLAARIAARIAHWLSSGNARFDDDGAPIAAGDVMILVRRRNAFFECMIRALKSAGVPVAGADRLTLTEHIAVKDLLACAEASLSPEDDLTVAVVLKSPLIGLHDDDLIAIAARRGNRSLIDALEEAGLSAQRYQEAAARLAGWRRLAARADPFTFFSTVLAEEGGRRRMLARLGPDAAEAMDVFLADALKWQTENTRSLFAFLDFMSRTSRTIKREFESSGNAVRVMTVHAAKGLEARIVFLADTLSAPHPRHDPKLFDLHAGKDGLLTPLPVWSPSKKHDPERLAQLRAQARDLALHEYRRLLYVGLTRAKDRLYVAGYLKKNTPKDGVWYRLIEQALEFHPNLSQLDAEDGSGPVMQWRSTGAAKPVEARETNPAQALVALPSWLGERPEDGIAGECALRPSARPNTLRTGRFAEQHSKEKQRGVLIHSLLEILPGMSEDGRRDAAIAILRSRDPDLGGSRIAEICETALRVLKDPRFAPLFAAGSRGEVEIGGEIATPAGRRPISARIDRIAKVEGRIWIIDFKSGIPPLGTDRIPPDMLRQLALYRAVMSEIYADEPVRVGILWTSVPRLDFAETSELDRAFDAALSREPLVDEE